MCSVQIIRCHPQWDPVWFVPVWVDETANIDTLYWGRGKIMMSLTCVVFSYPEMT